MKKKIDGLKQAIEMLQGLDLAAQQSLIAEIARKDPEMAIKLKQNLVTFDDLQYLTVSMMKRCAGRGSTGRSIASGTSILPSPSWPWIITGQSVGLRMGL